MPNGQRHKFKYLGGGAFQPPISIWSTLFKNSDNTYSLTMKGGEPIYTFSAGGYLTSIEDESGNRLEFTRDSSNQLEKVEDVLGRYIEFFFYPNGKISQIQDHTGRQLTYAYDGYGNLSSVEDPENRITTYKYESLNAGQEHFITSIEDNWGRIIAQIDYYPDRKVKSYTEKGETSTYVYPPSGQTSGITTKKDPYGNSWDITFNEKGVITKIKDPYNKTKTFTYDADYNMIQTTDEEGVNTQYAYESGKLTQLTRASGTSEKITWNYIYDEDFPEKIKKIQAPDNYQSIEYEYYPTGDPSEGKLYRIYRIRSDGETKDLLSTYTYNEEGQITSVTNALGKTTSYQYDSVGDLASVTYPKNSDTGSNPIYSYIYDSLGRTTSITDPLGSTTSYTYDSLGRVLTITLPRPNSSISEDFAITYTYDNYEVVDGKILIYTTQEDPNGRVTKYYYDESDQLVRVVDAGGKPTQFEYENGQLKTVKDANLNTTFYEYDKLSRLVTVYHPMGQTTGYTYYGDSLLKTKSDGKGQTISYIYDKLKRLREKQYPDGRKIRYNYYTYTGEMLNSIQDQVASETTNFNYDSSYRLSSISGPRGTISYAYTAADQIQSYQVSSEPAVSYSYYDDGSVKSITKSGDYPLIYYYTLNGQKEQIIYPNNSRVDYSYDDQGRLISIINSKPDASLLSSYSYGYDYDYATSSFGMKGFRTSMTNHLSQVEKYYFDDLYQLTRVDYPNGDMHQWSYDDIGNRTQQVVTPYGQGAIVTDYTYYQNSQSKNSQLLQSDGIYTYTWDNNGNLETKGATNYVWDYDDRLVGISSPTVDASYVYDYQGNRVRKTANGAESIYLYNDEDIVKETTGGVETDYLHGVGIDEPVMMDRAGAEYYYFRDGLGSIREMTDSGGTVQNFYNYGAWGEVRNQSAVVLNTYGYTGREFSEDGLYFYRARYLNFELGRFISEDPIGFQGGMNLYGYVGNNPAKYIDPFGLVTGGFITKTVYIPSKDLVRMKMSPGGAIDVKFKIRCTCKCTKGLWSPSIHAEVITIKYIPQRGDDVYQKGRPMPKSPEESLSHEKGHEKLWGMWYARLVARAILMEMKIYPLKLSCEIECKVFEFSMSLEAKAYHFFVHYGLYDTFWQIKTGNW